MKKILIIFLLLISSSAFAQEWVLFKNSIKYERTTKMIDSKPQEVDFNKSTDNSYIDIYGTLTECKNKRDKKYREDLKTEFMHSKRFISLLYYIVSNDDMYRIHTVLGNGTGIVNHEWVQYIFLPKSDVNLNFN